MTSITYYERRKVNQVVDFLDRRIAQRRNQAQVTPQEQRRLASQVRRYEREVFRIPVRLKVQNKEISGSTHDICPEGLLVFTDTTLSAGTPLTLNFSFGENVCHLNVSGQVVFCRSSENGGSSPYAIGITFCGIREFEKRILTSAVQELRQNAKIQQRSALNILVSEDTLAYEVTTFFLSNQFPQLLGEKPGAEVNEYENIEQGFESCDLSTLKQNKSYYVSIGRIQDSLNKWKRRYSYFRPIVSRLNTRVISRGQKLIMLASNDYLGLSSHPRVKEAGIKAIERYGTGTGSTVAVSGTLELHKLLEHRLAKFKSMESAILFGAGYMANTGTVSTLFQRDYVLLNDEKNHISIFEGSRASKSRVRVYRHNDIEHLEKLLKIYAKYQKVIITSSVFSIDGDLAYLKEISEMGRTYNALLMVDDNHATGVLGVNGKGSLSHFQIEGQVDIVTDGLGKALGNIGGYVAGSRETINYLRHFSMMTIFTTSLTPVICSGVLAALDVLETEKDLLVKLWANVKHLRNGLLNAGFNLGSSTTHIIPVYIGDESLAHQVALALQEKGIFVVAAARPAVRRGEARLRVTPMATHTTEELDISLAAFREVGKKFNLIS